MSYVYFLVHRSGKWFKIGKANCVFDRINSLGSNRFSLTKGVTLKCKSESHAFMVESAFHKYFSEHNCEKQIIVSVDGVEDGSTEFFSIDVYPSAIKLARSFEKVFDFEIETSDSTFDAIQRQKDFSQKAEKYRKLKENNPCLILDKVAEDLFGDKNALKDELKRDELDRFLFENSQRHMPKKVVELASSPSNLISGWRKYLNISEIEAAKRLRVSEKRYQEIECLRRVPKETKVKVCKAFGISMYNLDELVSL